MRSIAFLLLLAPTPALANVAAPPKPGVVSSAEPDAKTPLEALDEKLTLRCETTTACAFEAVYRVRNPTSETVEQRVVFRTFRARDLTVTVDGAEAELQAAPPAYDDFQALRAASFALAVPAGATRTMIVRGTVELVGRRYRGYLVPASLARHPAFGRADDDDRRVRLEYLLAPIKTWSGDASIDVEVHPPPGTRVDGAGLSPRGAAFGLVTKASTAPDVLSVAFVDPAPFVLPGGLLFGIGGSTGEAKGTRLRLGGEMALGESWLLASAVFETNARGAHYLVPALHAATPSLFIIPSLGIGVGVPVQVAPNARAGVRVQLDAHVFAVGFLTTLDWYPATATLPSLFQPSFLLQIGL